MELAAAARAVTDWPVPPAPPGLDAAARRAVLGRGDVEVVGRLPWASNGTFLATVTGDGVTIPAVYKPRRGERPLWDFPDGTLCHREVAAFVVSDALGWGIVPDTARRDGPLGIGMVQYFVDHDPEDTYFTLLAEHAPRLRQFALFDVVVNNADRKAGHCLRSREDGAVYGIDHGLTFHPAWKLRTVIWDFACEPLTGDELDSLDRLRAELTGDLGERLGALLSAIEIEALGLRLAALREEGTLPEPDGGYHSVPWPLV